jgi:predicted O-methyltransferase YrrM
LEDIDVLRRLVDEIKPTKALEVGSWKGLSSAIIARSSRELYCVDTWKGATNEFNMALEANAVDILSVFRNNMRLLNLTNIRCLVMSSEEAQNVVRREQFDFIYVDADHSYEAVVNDLSWYEWLKPGGTMAGHDFDEGHPGVKSAIEGWVHGSRVTIGEKSTVWYLRKEE